MNKPTILNESNFQAFINKAEPTLIDFWADWCGPCRMLTPVIEQVAAEVTGASVGKVNVDESEDLSAKYGINSIPTLLVFKGGELKLKSVGVKSKAQVLEMIEKVK